MYCNSCGHQNPLGANFCSRCGAPLHPGSGDAETATIPVDQLLGSDEAQGESGTPGATGTLVVTRGPNAGSRFALDAPLVTAGRHPDSDIFLDDVTVSRNHVELTRHPDGSYTVRDVGSLNGTYLNRDRIDEATLHGGDELQIGKFKLVFLDGGRPDADPGTDEATR